MNIFFSYSHVDRAIVDVLSSVMRNDGHNVLDDMDIKAGEIWTTAIAEQISNAEVMIPVITNHSYNNQWISTEIAFASTIKSDNKPLILPVVIGKNVPPLFDARMYQSIYIKEDVDSLSDDALDKVINQIRFGIELYKTKRDKEAGDRAKKHEESVTRIKSGISRYIDDVFHNLREEEKRNKRYAFSLYLISIISLVFSVSAVIFFSRKNPDLHTGYELWYIVAILHNGVAKQCEVVISHADEHHGTSRKS